MKSKSRKKQKIIKRQKILRDKVKMGGYTDDYHIAYQTLGNARHYMRSIQRGENGFDEHFANDIYNELVDKADDPRYPIKFRTSMLDLAHEYLVAFGTPSDGPLRHRIPDETHMPRRPSRASNEIPTGYVDDNNLPSPRRSSDLDISYLFSDDAGTYEVHPRDARVSSRRRSRT